MSNNLLMNLELTNEVKKFQERNSDEILDIILFGSFVRGKKKPNDIDILTIFKNKENFDLSYKLKKIFEKYKLDVEITNVIYQKMFDIDFLPRSSILSEGYSLIRDKTFSESFGFKSFIMFIYSQKDFSQTKRMRFHYALNGRNDNLGILEKISAIKLTDKCVISPLEKSEEFKDFLDFWDISFSSFNILMTESTIEYEEFKI